MAAASAPWLGGVLDRLGVRKVVVSCLAVSGCAVASLAALTPALGHLRIVFGVLGLVMMGASPIAYSRAIFGWFDRSRGRALGVMLAGASLSGIVLPPVAQGLIDLWGWRLAWLVLGCATLAIALPSAVRFIRERQSPNVAGDIQPPEVPVAAAFRSRVFWTLVVVVFGGTVATNGALVHLVALLADRGVPASQAATSVSAMAAAGLIGRVVTGWLLEGLANATGAVVVSLVTGLRRTAHPVRRASHSGRIADAREERPTHRWNRMRPCMGGTLR